MKSPVPDTHVALAPSPLDSARFGLRVYRGAGDRVNIRELFEDLVRFKVDVAIIRTPAGSSNWARASRYGLQPIHADTLIYYQADLTTYQPKALRNADLSFAEATEHDRIALTDLVRASFEGYTSHYHANPALEANDILAGYMEWATSHVSNAPSRVTWVARRKEEIVAFACCSFDRKTNACEGVLYGVHPSHTGGGLYGDLIRHTQAMFKARGFADMRVSTQIWNYAVQKVWAREGFSLARAYDTWHLNPMLDGGTVIVERALSFSSAQVASFAAVTGDANPVHFDDDAARAAGFPTKISHGMLVGSELSRIFGMEIPGPGTLFLNANFVFNSPIFQGREYRLRVRALKNSAGRFVSAVATVHDPNDTLCVLCYSDLLKRS